MAGKTRRGKKKKTTTENVEVKETKKNTKKEVEEVKETKTKKVVKEEPKKETTKKEREIVELPPRKKYTQEEIDEATNKAKADLFKEIIPYIIIIVCVVFIRMFIVTPVDVSGSSMYPTLKDGDVMLLYKLRLKTVGINRFDIVVVNTDEGKLIKRVIGLPGDKISYEVNDDEETGTLYINGEKVKEDFITDIAKAQTCKYNSDICLDEITVPDGEYYVMGDNRGNSKDSRMIGTIEKEDIAGIASVVIWPINRFGSKN